MKQAGPPFEENPSPLACSLKNLPRRMANESPQAKDEKADGALIILPRERGEKSMLVDPRSEETIGEGELGVFMLTAVVDEFGVSTGVR